MQEITIFLFFAMHSTIGTEFVCRSSSVKDYYFFNMHTQYVHGTHMSLSTSIKYLLDLFSFLHSVKFERISLS